MISSTYIHKALTIAGSDSGGGAGIQADLKTFQELGVYGMSAITAITAQNTLGVQSVYPVENNAISAQLQSIGDDLPPYAIKTGMLANADVIKIVAENMKKYGWRNLVIDPVMIAKGGTSLLAQEALDTLIAKLIPLAEVVTPNIPEAEVLTGVKIVTLEDRKEAAMRLFAMGANAVVMKGGHDPSTGDVVVDMLFERDEVYTFESPRINTRHTHGTGCTFSAAITSGLAIGGSLLDSVTRAKAFIDAAIEHQLGFGAGHGPTNHFAYKRVNRD
ncbi:bifunctional hydroxymethylpyrimidine kinase/phosphomethylpyrimidine kinase [Paenibacillus sp. GSMTC-2017]|uniref:bifunctional hydroxymethylpyrimidine kinase/phosphomethylpyrimidine kinase n=1 Tax=Paenibacillus sp. GSMTC-2017 TaxID=2794350 RepID=UPI0018D9B4ED|nr:bifunctional hydroxymethylpyrimidine kinase/phosphomethylpyrimidine kinase [Paenibacillus sp. GSMTC-2017]MBH5319965.1 bifunctional hydroxymethylpyrimidine kinase/phosphomethylpyrimidine kinase [Paenibacillus sp. GSMTC-2017]